MPSSLCPVALRGKMPAAPHAATKSLGNSGLSLTPVEKFDYNNK